MLKKLFDRLGGLNYNITYGDVIVELISEVGFDETYGARPLKRAIQDKIEDFISEEVLKGSLSENTPYKLIAVDKEVKIEEIEEKPKRGRKKKGVE